MRLNKGWILVGLLLSSVTAFGYYSPKTGRFLQRDPLGVRDGTGLVEFADTGAAEFPRGFNPDHQYTEE